MLKVRDDKQLQEKIAGLSVPAAARKFTKGVMMPVENVLLFLQKVNDDEQLQQKISNLGADSWENMLIGLTRLGAEEGLPFSADDFVRFQQELFASFNPNGELNDEQLELVAGGTIPREILHGYALISQAATRAGFAPSFG